MAEAVIQHCKKIFSRHGIPGKIVTNNGLKFDSNVFYRFSKEYHFFHHLTSSPYYLRTNGGAEQGVKTVKALLKKVDELYLVLLAYRSN